MMKEVLIINQIFLMVSSLNLFLRKKIFIISRVTEKFNDIIEQIIEKIKDITIILNAPILDKKSKLRKLFEKEKI